MRLVSRRRTCGTHGPPSCPSCPVRACRGEGCSALHCHACLENGDWLRHRRGTVPAGACPHFHDAASPVRRHWRTGTPYRVGGNPPILLLPPLKIDGSEREPRLSYSTEIALAPFSLSVRFSNHWCGLQRPGEFSPQSGWSAGHWIRHGQHATLRNLVLLPTLPGLIEEP